MNFVKLPSEKFINMDNVVEVWNATGGLSVTFISDGSTNGSYDTLVDADAEALLRYLEKAADKRYATT